jgi:1-acyl-sn-glycerol-3-phosphate acyltransferase
VSARARVGRRIRSWHPAPPPLPPRLAGLVGPDDPDWFARELAVAAAPPWWFGRLALSAFSRLPGLFGRLQVTGSIREEWLRGPLLLAANHIGDFDTFVVAAALHRAGVYPRFMATGSIVAAPVVGPLLERAGVIRVVRGTDLAAHAVRIARVALDAGGQVVAYPEGRVGLAPDGWPERGRTGLARMALDADVPVVPISQWGAHRVLQYANDRGKLRTALSAVRRRPALRVHLGPPVYFEDLRPGRVGDANRARTRIAAAITRGLAPLRAGEPSDRMAYVDPTRPTTGVAAFPGGVVPPDIP